MASPPAERSSGQLAGRRLIIAPETAPERYVVDAALVAKWAFPEPTSEHAIAVLDAQCDGHVELIAPDLLVAELASLCRRKVRAGEIDAAAAGELFTLLLEVAPELVPSSDLAAAALELSLRHDRPFGDGLHLALALREGIPYLVADERLLRVLAHAFACVRYLGDLVESLP